MYALLALSQDPPSPEALNIAGQQQSRLTLTRSQGLRGFASILVVAVHINRAFDPGVFLARNDESPTSRVVQYPIIRVFAQGRIGVAIFSLVTGYVCALKPIRQIRAGNPEQCLSTISRSAFRRVPRLVLPTAIVSALIWLMVQCGGFLVSKRWDSRYILDTTRDRAPNLGAAILALFHGVIDTWTEGGQPYYTAGMYDNHQWTLFPLLKGAMLVYMMMVSTAYLKSRHRMVIEAGLFVYYYITKDGRSLAPGSGSC